MNKTKMLTLKDKKYVWHPFTQQQDWEKDDVLVIEKGAGNYLVDTKGQKYLDGVSSLWCNVHGHRKRALDQALKKQIGKIAHSTFLGLSNPPAIELAEALIKIAPKGLTRVFYSDSGSEAVEIALKMAYQYWQQQGEIKRQEFVTLGEAYHGDTIGSVSLGGIDLFHSKFGKLLFRTHKMCSPHYYRFGSGLTHKQFLNKCISELEAVVKKNAKRLAAIVMEPRMQGAAGMIHHPEGFLRAARRIADYYGIFLILDEVATGFGRTGRMFACEHEGVKPDILCLAKGITGGYLPLAATLTTEKIYRGFLGEHSDFKTFFHGHTYTGNPLACAVALENLKIFRREKTIQKLQPKIKLLQKGLERFWGLKAVGDIRQEGFMVGVELVENRKTKKPFLPKEKIGIRVCQEIRKHGVILRSLGNVIVLMPPLSITEAQLKKLLAVTYNAVVTVTTGLYRSGR